jgi:hypothetical protein
VRSVVADSSRKASEALDAASLEEARAEIRAGVREGLEPLRELIAAVEGTMRKAIELGEYLRKKRGDVR